MGKVIKNSDRGVTICKGLAWIILSVLVVAGIWVGTQTATMSSDIRELESDLNKAVIQVAAEVDKRDRLAARKAKSATRSASHTHLSRGMRDL
ncbi:hypothetical protein [Phaeobacter sp. NW0010-22]|uniref:hypothetical protein n=1 Tax=Phaeobacter sp. NW0010-22 TaxID=3135907 RepID=UPI00310A5277